MPNTPSNPIRRLWLSIALIHALLVVGAVGLMVVGDRSAFEAFYLTVVILTTVGMEGPASNAERAWSIVIMVAGVGTVIYATGQVVAFFVEGEVRNILGRHKVQSQINYLQDHTIVVGYGRMGRALCAKLVNEDRPFVLIEGDPQRCADARESGCLVLQGDAMAEQTLCKAGIERASGLASCLPRDADNVFVTLSASGLRPGLHIVARAEDQSAAAKLERAGATRVICPPQISALQVSDMLLHPGIDDVLELDGRWPDLELSQVCVQRFPAVVGLRLGELVDQLGGRTVPVAVISADGQRHLAPASNTTIAPADELVLIGPKGWMAGLETIGRAAA